MLLLNVIVTINLSEVQKSQNDDAGRRKFFLRISERGDAKVIVKQAALGDQSCAENDRAFLSK